MDAANLINHPNIAAICKALDMPLPVGLARKGITGAGRADLMGRWLKDVVTFNLHGKLLEMMGHAEQVDWRPTEFIAEDAYAF